MLKKKWLILFLALFFVVSCGEPAPMTQTSVTHLQQSEYQNFAQEITYQLASEELDTHLLLLDEVVQSEFEATKWVLQENNHGDLLIKLMQYEFRRSDPIDWVPGAFIPGFIPFGPLSFWWIYQDLKIQTPSLEIVLEARFNGNVQKIRSKIIRAVSREEDLARVAYSEAVRKIKTMLQGAAG